MSIRLLPGFGDPTYLIDVTAGNETFLLPKGFAAGRIVTFRRVDATANTATVQAPTGDTLDGTLVGTTTVTANSQKSFDAIEVGTWVSFGGGSGGGGTTVTMDADGTLVVAGTTYEVGTDAEIATAITAGNAATLAAAQASGAQKSANLSDVANATTARNNLGAEMGLTATAVKTTSYTAAAGDLVPVDTTGGAVTITLPTAPANLTRIGVKHVTQGGTNTVTIALGGSDVFNVSGGATTGTLTLLNQSLIIQYKATGAIWTVTSSDMPLSQLDLRFAQRSNNLSDVANAATARTNLGLGNSSTRAVGTTSSTVAAGDAPATAAATATVAQAFGLSSGSPISPATVPVTIGDELWTLANMGGGGALQNTTLTPTLTCNGTNNNWVTTRVVLGNMINKDTSFRLEFDYALTGISAVGWATISLALMDATGTMLTGTARQYVVTAASERLTGHFIHDFQPVVGVTSSTLSLEVRLESYTNAPSGTVAITNVSVRMIGSSTVRPMLVAQNYSTGVWPEIHWQQRDVKSDAWKMSKLAFTTDGALTPAFSGVDGFTTDMPFTFNSWPDPTFVRTAPALGTTVGSSQASATTYSLRVGNNDQVMEPWNGTAFELRCNAHGGETIRGSASYKIDQGSGLTAWTLSHGLVPVRRFQATVPTQVATTTGTTFANVDHTFTCFEDGMIRCDRTTTFLNSQLVQNQFDWLSSHSITQPYLGRLGRGLTVLGETDSHNKATAPTLTPSTSGTGGTLAAATYSYKITAVTPYGESTPSAAVTQATTGTTSTVTLTWSAASNATAYRVYGRTAGVERLLATVPLVTTWTDDGSLGTQPTAPPTVNTARYYPGTSNAADAESSSEATWGVYYEPLSGWCYGQIYDRDSILTRTGVRANRIRVMASVSNSIQKIYNNVYWTSGTTYTVPNGTVWTATHYSFSYIPYDVANFHNEIAVRAANLSALSALYPNT